ncbi:MAG: hypothetical protein ACRYGB_04455 [Janthinobacterium lividum]
MKQLLLLISLSAIFTCNLSAQKVTKTDTSKRRIANVVLVPPPPNTLTVPSNVVSKHIGEYVTVCDKVYSTRLMEGSNMTLLNLGGNYPNQTLTIMIPGADRSKFKEHLETYFKGRSVCVAGKVIDYNGKPEIIVSDPAKLKLELTDNPF